MKNTGVASATLANWCDEPLSETFSFCSCSPRCFREFGVIFEAKKGVSVSVVMVSNHGILVKD